MSERSQTVTRTLRSVPLLRAAVVGGLVTTTAVGVGDVAITLDEWAVAVPALTAVLPYYDLVDSIDTIFLLLGSLLFAIWFARATAVARERGGAVPPPFAAGIVQFFYPWTLFFPYLHMRSVARSLGAKDAIRPALLMYLLVLPTFAGFFLYEIDALWAWLLGDVAWTVGAVASGLFMLVVIDRLSVGVAEVRVADVFA